MKNIKNLYSSLFSLKKLEEGREILKNLNNLFRNKNYNSRNNFYFSYLMDSCFLKNINKLIRVIKKDISDQYLALSSLQSEITVNDHLIERKEEEKNQQYLSVVNSHAKGDIYGCYIDYTQKQILELKNKKNLLREKENKIREEIKTLFCNLKSFETIEKEKKEQIKIEENKKTQKTIDEISIQKYTQNAINLSAIQKAVSS